MGSSSGVSVYPSSVSEFPYLTGSSVSVGGLSGTTVRRTETGGTKTTQIRTRGAEWVFRLNTVKFVKED